MRHATAKQREDMYDMIRPDGEHAPFCVYKDKPRQYQFHAAAILSHWRETEYWDLTSRALCDNMEPPTLRGVLAPKPHPHDKYPYSTSAHPGTG